MTTNRFLMVLSLLSSPVFAQEAPRRPAERPPAVADREEKAREKEILGRPEYHALVEQVVTQCNGDLDCMERVLNGVLSSTSSSDPMKHAARHILHRVQNAKASQEGKEEQERRRIAHGVRNHLVGDRLEAARQERQRFEEEGRRLVASRQMTQEELERRLAAMRAAHQALEKRLRRAEPAPGGGRGQTPAPPRGEERKPRG